MVWERSDLTGEQGFKPVLQTFVTRPVELVHLTYRRATGRAHGSAFRGAKSSESGDGDSDPDPSDDLSDKASAASEALAKSDSKLVGTPNHPFWSVTRQAWVEMGRRQPGERLLLSDGREAVVETLEREYAPAVFENWTPGQATTGTLGTPADPTTGTFTTYNFEVADWHTYFVSDDGSIGASWVHNTGALCDQGLDRAAQAYKRYAKEGRGAEYLAKLKDKGVTNIDDVLNRARMPNVRLNQAMGSRREAESAVKLAQQYPGARVIEQPYLRNQAGDIIRDRVTGKARRLDQVVVHDGVAVDAVEVTSRRADKAAQLGKEGRIRNNGGYFILDPATGNTIPVPLSRIDRFR